MDVTPARFLFSPADYLARAFIGSQSVRPQPKNAAVPGEYLSSSAAASPAIFGSLLRTVPKTVSSTDLPLGRDFGGRNHINGTQVTDSSWFGITTPQ
jgi:hypothetical protein